jgi:hypothetical protein
MDLGPKRSPNEDETPAAAQEEFHIKPLVALDAPPHASLLVDCAVDAGPAGVDRLDGDESVADRHA